MYKNRYQSNSSMMIIQNQKAHYEKILNAKKQIDFKKKKSKDLIQSMHFNHPNPWGDKKRIQDNQKLLNTIIQIKKQKGLLQKIDQASKSKEKRKLKTTINFQQKEKQISVLRENQQLADRIFGAKPMIGTKNSWNKHFKEYKRYGKKLSKFKQNERFDFKKNFEVKLLETHSSSRNKNKRELLQGSKHKLPHEEKEKSIKKNIKSIIHECVIKTGENNEPLSQSNSNKEKMKQN